MDLKSWWHFNRKYQRFFYSQRLLSRGRRALFMDGIPHHLHEPEPVSGAIGWFGWWWWCSNKFQFSASSSSPVIWFIVCFCLFPVLCLMIENVVHWKFSVKQSAPVIRLGLVFCFQLLSFSPNFNHGCWLAGCWLQRHWPLAIFQWELTEQVSIFGCSTCYWQDIVTLHW